VERGAERGERGREERVIEGQNNTKRKLNIILAL